MEAHERIIEQLQLEAHPEGGFFKETYRSSFLISYEDVDDKGVVHRNCATCIYFLLTSTTFSAFHKIGQDEIWHFYKGSPIVLHMISPAGAHSEVIIGNDLEVGQFPQYVVPKEHWFAAKTLGKEGYSLVGCTVAPGFDFKDFELAERDKMISQFPDHKDLIEAFTRV
ncbi:MAG: cupin domain-containing protein [Flavobacteriaceae bacterium]